MIDLQLHNTLEWSQRNLFQQIRNTSVYVCGPTVYDYVHIGNGSTGGGFDVLIRLLERHYPKVTYVSNITDIDDKIIRRRRPTMNQSANLPNALARLR